MRVVGLETLLQLERDTPRPVSPRLETIRLRYSPPEPSSKLWWEVRIVEQGGVNLLAERRGEAHLKTPLVVSGRPTKVELNTLGKVSLPTNLTA